MLACVTPSPVCHIAIACIARYAKHSCDVLELCHRVHGSYDHLCVGVSSCLCV